MLSRRSLLGAAGAVIALPAVARAPSRWPSVQTLLDRYIAERRYAGIATALSYGNSPVAYPTAGKLAYDSLAAIDRNSLFRIYSLTKPITGIAAMLLIEDGRIELDQPVADVLPELIAMQVATAPAAGLDSRPATRPLTMRQLLTHTSGLSNWQPTVGDTPIARAYRSLGITPGNFVHQPGEDGYAEQVGDLAAMIARLPEVPLIAEPGTAWNYSMGLDVMGAVIDRASGIGLEAFLRRRLFGPLRMRSTGFHVASRDAARLTTLYGRSSEGQKPVDRGETSIWLRQPKLIAAGGGLVSSATDLDRFARMLLNEGELDKVRIMKAATVRLAMSNLLPPGIAYPPTGGFGAGAGVVMPGVASENGPPGTYAAVGASSTSFAVDPARRGTAVFLAQYMPGRVPQSEALRFRVDFNAAIAADLAALR